MSLIGSMSYSNNYHQKSSLSQVKKTSLWHVARMYGYVYDVDDFFGQSPVRRGDFLALARRCIVSNQYMGCTKHGSNIRWRNVWYDIVNLCERLCFWEGGFDKWSMLPKASPEYNHEHIMDRLKILKLGGGLFFNMRA